MAFVSRWHGGGFFYAPKALISLMWALPFAYLVYPNIYAVIIVLALTALAKSTGHGNFMDLGTWTKPSEPERLEFLIKPLKNKLSPYWYDFTGLTMLGVIGALPAAIALFSLNSFILIAGGVGKAIAYAIGWKIGKYPTEVGEILTGLFAGVSIYFMGVL